jgi:hypothetical protein
MFEGTPGNQVSMESRTMFSLKSGLEARSYWNSILKQQEENALPVDRAALLAQMQKVRPETQRLLQEVERDGVAIIENYWTAEQCAQAISEVENAIETYPEAVRKFSADSDYRMFGIEMVGPMAMKFHDDEYLRMFGEVAGNRGLYNFATLGARIRATAENRGSGDGWHRDAFGYQFKAIVYLSDVASENGPFEYLIGSHKNWRVFADSALGRLPGPPQSRIEDSLIQKSLASGRAQSRQFTAKAGTVVLVNTAGVHRGMPLKSGSRYALTNYYYHHYQIGQSMLDKFAPMMPGAAERVAKMMNT